MALKDTITATWDEQGPVECKKQNDRKAMAEKRRSPGCHQDVYVLCRQTEENQQ